MAERISFGDTLILKGEKLLLDNGANDGIIKSKNGTLKIDGNLTVTGITTTVDSETVTMQDNIIVLNSNAIGSATENSGIEIERGDDTNVTIIWDETDDKWTVGSHTFVAATFEGNLTGNLTGDVTGDITSSGSTFSNIDINGGNIDGAVIGASVPQVGTFTTLNATTINGAVTGTVSSISNHSTTDLSEGTNLYYTDARVDTHLNQSNPTSGHVLSWNGADYSWAPPLLFDKQFSSLEAVPTTIAGYGITDSPAVINDARFNVGLGEGVFDTFTSNQPYRNTAMGYEAIHSIAAASTQCNDNTAFGYKALRLNSIGTKNTAIGSEALLVNTEGANNVAVGYRALAKNIGVTASGGDNNIAVGNSTLYDNTEGAHNIAIGSNAVSGLTTGDGNIGIGSNSGAYGDGNHNTTIGHDAESPSGDSNINIGHQAGNDGNGDNNIAIGERAGYGTGGGTNPSNTIAIGYEAGKFNAYSNKLFIANSSSSNLISGDFTAGTVTFNDAYTFPSADGTASQVLTTDGAGNLSWSTPTITLSTLKSVVAASSDFADFQSRIAAL